MITDESKAIMLAVAQSKTVYERVTAVRKIVGDARAAEKADVHRAMAGAVLERMNRFASGHHFAGDLAGEKSFRRCMDEIRALLDDADLGRWACSCVRSSVDDSMMQWDPDCKLHGAETR